MDGNGIELRFGAGVWLGALPTRYGILEVLVGGTESAPDRAQLDALRRFRTSLDDNIRELRRDIRFGLLWRPIRLAVNNRNRVGVQFRNRITGNQDKLLLECCPICFRLPRKPKAEDYFEVISEWASHVDSGRFRLIAGDCPLADIGGHIEREDLFAIEHYFQCECGRYYHSGICIRSSTPILEMLVELPGDFRARFAGKFAQTE